MPFLLRALLWRFAAKFVRRAVDTQLERRRSRQGHVSPSLGRRYRPTRRRHY